MKILTSGTYYRAKKSEAHFARPLLSEYDYTSQSADWHFMLSFTGQ